MKQDERLTPGELENRVCEILDEHLVIRDMARKVLSLTAHQAQLAKADKHKLDGPDREIAIRAIEAFLAADKMTHRQPKATQILVALERIGYIPDEEEIRAKLNAEIRIELGSKAFEKGQKQERERIFSEVEKIFPWIKQGVNTKPWQALKQSPEGG